ncbi:hypothetical protein AB3R30_01675 [Leptolyngbyaceae cyanobacterium UHCC 1019]
MRTLKLEELAEIKAMCDRARQLEKVNQSIQDVTAQIDGVVALAGELGVSVKTLQNQK